VGKNAAPGGCEIARVQLSLTLATLLREANN
jgi:hypothetical protein